MNNGDDAETARTGPPVNADLPAQLSTRLRHPLPGWSAHAPFQPELSFGRHRGPAPGGARPAAVLVLLYPRDGAWHVPMILRPAHMVDHANQVSLPGGTIEAGEDSREAALRELCEELGVPTDGIDVLGELSPLYLFASNFQVAPWVGAVRTLPKWQPNAHEVEQLLEVPLAHLVAPENRSFVTRRQRGLTFQAPCFDWQEHRIWGATSMVLAELVATLAGLEL